VPFVRSLANKGLGRGLLKPMKESHRFVPSNARRIRLALVIAGLIMPLAASAQSPDFSEARLSAGQEAYREKRALDAIDQFRIAGFGFLERPSLLSETLARLALAYAAAGRTEEVEATLTRFLQVERRFACYGKVKLEPDVRAEFHSLLLQRVPQATLVSHPALTGLVETQEQKIAKLPSRERRKALEAAFRRDPGNVVWPLMLAREAAEREDHKRAVRWTGEVLKRDAENADALALRAHARAARRECAAALADVKALPESELARRPEIHADRFVCLVESGDWAGAEAAAKLVPEKLLLRSDVIRAEEKLAAERSRRGRETAGNAGGAHSSPENRRDRPESAPPPAAPAAAPKGPAAGAEEAGKKPEENPAPPLSRATPEVLADSRRLVAARKVVEAQEILLEALRSEPANRELRLALLEASCLSRAWDRGVEQLSYVSPFSEEEAAPMFYAAVVLYETGRTEEARKYIESALPRLSGPFVDEYARKILGRL